MERLTLLDGKTWDKPELLDNMMNDEFYYGYLSKAALSSSSAKMLLDSPKTYHNVTTYGQPDLQAFRTGWLFHTSILEPEVFESQVFVDVQSKNTKAYKLAQEEHGRVFTVKEKKEAERMADAFYRNERARELITNCEFEVPAIDEIMGIPFRGKADVLGKNRVVDLKSTNDLKAFPFSAKKYSYDMQCYLYSYLFNIDYQDFTFIALDKGSLDIGIYDCSEEFYFSGEQKVAKAIKTFETFFQDGADLDQYYITGTL